jgi:hypothetical protein
MLTTPTQAKKTISLRKERRRINKALGRGIRVLYIPNEVYILLVAELRNKGWHVEHGLSQYSSCLREVYVRDL